MVYQELAGNLQGTHVSRLGASSLSDLRQGDRDREVGGGGGEEGYGKSGREDRAGVWMRKETQTVRGPRFAAGWM